MTLIPNAFQVSNLYIDRAMALLNEPELRVLIYSIRHIMGWQDKINSRRGRISISMYENGFVTNDGTVYDGCGLKRQAVINGVDGCVKFGFLIKIGEPTPDGQEYELGQEIKWEELESRQKEELEQNRKRTLKATMAKQVKKLAGTSHVPLAGTSHDTMQGNVPRTSAGTSHVLNQSHLQSHLQSQEEKDSSPVGGLPQSIPEIAGGNLEDGFDVSLPIVPDVEQIPDGEVVVYADPIQSLEGNAQNGAALPDLKPPVPPRPLSPSAAESDKKAKPKNPLQEAVAYAFSTNPGPFAGQLGSMLTGTATKGQWKEWAITDPPMTPAEIWGARLWYNGEARYKDQCKNGLPRTAETLHTRILEYRSSPKHAEFLRRAENLLAAHLGQDTAELDETDFQNLFPPPEPSDGIPYTGQPSTIDLKKWLAEYDQQKAGAV